MSYYMLKICFHVVVCDCVSHDCLVWLAAPTNSKTRSRIKPTEPKKYG